MREISRRAVLRGFGATLALPFLDAMATPAVADGPTRLVFLGVEGGIWTGDDGFFPCLSGPDAKRVKDWGTNGVLPGGAVADLRPDFALPTALRPLAGLRDDVLILSGLHHKYDRIWSATLGDHGQDLGTLLTGCNISGTPDVTVKNSISIDQVVADKIGDATRFPSLQLAVGTQSYNTKEATGLDYMGFLSYDADGYALPVEAHPGAIFDRLFTDGSGKQKSQREAERRRLKSVLDGVLEDMKSLRGSLAPRDRRKLEEYATTVREVERRIERARAWEDKPVRLPEGARRPELDKDASRQDQIRLTLDLLALALQTDVSRVATLRMGGYFGSFAFLGFPEDPHGVYAHNDGKPERVKGARAIDRFHVEQLAYFLERLKGLREGERSLLDRTAVMYGAGLTNGPAGVKHVLSYQAHGQDNVPILLAGGGLKTGRHVNFDHGTPLANLFVTLGELAGVPGLKFADSTGPLAGLV